MFVNVGEVSFVKVIVVIEKIYDRGNVDRQNLHKLIHFLSHCSCDFFRTYILS